MEIDIKNKYNIYISLINILYFSNIIKHESIIILVMISYQLLLPVHEQSFPPQA